MTDMRYDTALAMICSINTCSRSIINTCFRCLINMMFVRCVCYEGYAGDACETAVPCTSNPCDNDGDCADHGDSGYTCNCKDG